MNVCCTVCQKEKSPFFMGHRQICFRCDELLIDLEMEIETETKRPELPSETVLEDIEVETET